MKPFQKFWKRLKSIKNLPAMLSIILITIGGFNPNFLGGTIEKYLLLAVGLLCVNIIIERLSTLSDIQDELKSTSEIVQEIKKTVQETEIEVLDDREALERVRLIISRCPIEHVEILSSGLISRQDLIMSLLKRKIKVTAYVQDPSTAIDNWDADRLRVSLDMINRTPINNINLFNLYFHINVSTVRAIIVSEAHSDIKHLCISWYFYTHQNKKIFGSQNPTIYCSTTSKQGQAMYDWLKEVIQKNHLESKKVEIEEFINA